jgi:enoyl-CoA hydratase/carnithine racemase
LSSPDGEPPSEAVELADGKLLLDRPAEHVARLTISNPAKRNALDHSILGAIAASVGDLDARCLVLTGAHGMFSAGYDIGELPEEMFAEDPDPIAALEGYPYATVAALPGHTIGGGLELALACDLRIAATPLMVGMPPAKLGLVYSHTGVQRFLDTIGAARTRELFLLGRNIAVEQALDWGLVNWVVAPERLGSAALELARDVAATAPLSLRGNKRVIRELMLARRRLGADTERELAQLRAACFASEDFREGVRAFADKRAPRWRGR